jgi:tetratricopeptide (TPR) repeat protein
MASWATFPFSGDYHFDADSVQRQWSRLHAGDLEPLPANPQLLQTWAHFHNGEFEKAFTQGLHLGAAGLNVANKAACMYATYLETQEARRLALFQEVAERADAQLQEDPDNFNARYLRAYALGRYSQGISVAKALAQGLGYKVKSDLEAVIAQAPGHHDAHVALGAFHAEVIDKVGSLIGAMTYGANRDLGLKLFSQAVRLNVQSAFGLLEYAHALLMLDGEKMLSEALRMYRLAARTQPADAAERLEVEMAKTELANQ